MPHTEPAFSQTEMADIEADAYFTALEALERAERAAKDLGITRAKIAKKSGIDAASITRVLGGANKSINLKTLFKIMAAMNRKVFITSEDINNLQHLKPNFNFDAPKFDISPRIFGHVIRSREQLSSSYANAQIMRERR